LKKKFFGTDGIRGRVGAAPITVDFVLKLGWAAGRVLAATHYNPTVLIGKDTRISGYMFESALEAGLSAAGVNTLLLGPMPTPAIAYLTRTFQAAAGIVISASHNPYYDNGIKFFAKDGKKLPDDVELAIEAEIDVPLKTVCSSELGKAKRVLDAAGRYIEFCKSSLTYAKSLHGIKVVIDCANGATYRIAPNVFRELGAQVYELGNEPDGLNINQDCGATSPDNLVQAVLEHKADCGIALDGDGDRVIMVDAVGNIIDGDSILYVLAMWYAKTARLQGGVVGTVMTNLGLAIELEKNGIGFFRSKVGDRQVLEAMQAKNWNLGGESSGHIICLDFNTTGDGIVSALKVLEVMVHEQKGLAELCAGMKKYPQVLRNLPFNGDSNIVNDKAVQDRIASVQNSLGSNGRLLVRPSGTEPLMRIMVEGTCLTKVNQAADDLESIFSEINLPV